MGIAKSGNPQSGINMGILSLRPRVPIICTQSYCLWKHNHLQCPTSELRWASSAPILKWQNNRNIYFSCIIWVPPTGHAPAFLSNSSVKVRACCSVPRSCTFNPVQQGPICRWSCAGRVSQCNSLWLRCSSDVLPRLPVSSAPSTLLRGHAPSPIRSGGPGKLQFKYFFYFF